MFYTKTSPSDGSDPWIPESYEPWRLCAIVGYKSDVDVEDTDIEVGGGGGGGRCGR